MNTDSQKSSDAKSVAAAFSSLLGGVTPSSYIKSRPDGEFIIFEFASPSERHFRLANQVNESLSEDHSFKDRIGVTSRKKKPSNVLATPEAVMLQRELAASLTVDRYTFGENFLDRYTESVTNLEDQIVVAANHMVFGRRGSGKSSLLAFSMHQLRNSKQPFAWIAMQTYAGRSDIQVSATIIGEIISEASRFADSPSEFLELAAQLTQLGESDDGNACQSRLARIIPRIRRLLSEISSPNGTFTIFLDDIHVLGKAMQAQVLSSVYSLTRGNRAFIKASGIEQLTNLWDGIGRIGLESPHDVQILKLDHNLTSPDQSKMHIKSILDRHARYCGLPEISYVAGQGFIDRLVLSAAAVPRDSLSLFSKAITRSLAKGQKMASVTSLNAATSEAMEEKLRDVQKDVSQADGNSVSAAIERVKKFCLNQEKKNSFLVKIDNASSGYKEIEKLIALRFIHVLHEGITPHKAGERFVALMLDYGFYIGIRAAKSVALYPDTPRPLPAKELRKLPIFKPV